MATADNRMSRKQLIFDAAEQVFSKYGFDASRVDDIAQKAGIAKGTIYLYFPSKQELFISLVETRIMEFEGLLEERLAYLTGAEDILRTLVLTRVQFYMMHMGMVNMLFQSMGQFSKELQIRLIDAQQNIQRISRNFFTDVLPANYPIPADTLRSMVSGSVNGLIAELLMAKKEIVPEEITQYIVAAFLPSIQKYQS